MKYIMRIKSLNTNTYLNVYGNDTISNSRNVTLWELDENAKSQKWQLDTKNEKYIISSLIDTSYNLDFYRGSSSLGNCTVYKHGNDITDAEIKTIREQNDFSKYLIFNIKEEKYLTVEESGNGRSNVVWREALYDNDHRQEWKLEFIKEIPDEPPVAGGKKLNMSVCYNQKWSGFNEYINGGGCALCCGAAVSSYYAGKEISPNDLPYEKRVYEGFKYSWYTWASPHAKINELYENITFAKVCEEIDQGYPVIINGKNGDKQHWVVAYGYIGKKDGSFNNACDRARILVYDSYNEKGNSEKYGVCRNLQEALDLNYNCFNINRLKITRPK